MIVAHKPGGMDWLIPEAFRSQFESFGFVRFSAPPSNVADYPEPILLDDALKARQPSEAVTDKAAGVEESGGSIPAPAAVARKRARR